MRLRTLPNVITVGRIVLVAPVLWLLLERRFASALALFVVAGASDALDGYLAKHYGWTSRLGAILDPLADKLLMVTCYVALGWLGLLPWWLIAAVIARDVIILGGATVYQMTIARLEIAPSLLSKTNTVCQILLVVAVIGEQVVNLSTWWVPGLVWLVLFTTLGSGLSYVWVWSRRARRMVHSRERG